MRSWWTLLLSTLLAGLTACGMTVKVKPIGEVQYPENANRELDFFTEPLDWMDPVVVIGIQGADDDQYMAVRKRACEIAAKHGAEALLVIDEKRVAGGWHTSNVTHFTDFDVVEYQRNWRPDCLYIGVRRVQETPEKKK